MQYIINRELDSLYWSNEFNQDLSCRVTNLLSNDSAHTLKKEILKYASFKQAHISNGKYSEISKDEFAQLDLNDRRTLVQNVHKLASDGVGFWYGRQELSQSSTPHLANIYSWLSSEEMIKNIRTITGISSLAYPSAQITAFAPGDFLTRHRDDVSAEKRRVAFVYNLSENWHPDWGGLLQFYKDDGTPTKSWSPTYNSLCLFHVKHIHSVTCVAPFAPKLRLAISGWFHDK
ncbi:2OG-Fe(II) oxygenase family protein [Microbulbifer sp. EKSA008]|uniref:2OG-Fe(II) oxygenase family protein n=1 Tax=unclassified Microbulbifer TaxID=2619833 RepID=UPI0039B504D6